MTFPGLNKYLKGRDVKTEQLFELFKGTQIDAIQTTIGRKIEWGDTVKA